MTTNPILDELHAARAKLLADVDGDVDRLLAGIREREAESIRHSAAPKSAKASGNWQKQLNGSHEVGTLEAGREDCLQDESSK